jgi:hypothetical protein
MAQEVEPTLREAVLVIGSFEAVGMIRSLKVADYPLRLGS